MKHWTASFEEMVAPLSISKVLVVVECLNIEACERPDIMQGLSELMDLKYGPGFDEWDDFLDFGFVLIEGDVNDAHVAEGNLMIDYLRNEKFRALIQADLFVDGAHVGCSWEGEPDLWNEEEPEKLEKSEKAEKSVVLRFPIEKIKRHHEPNKKNDV